MGDTKMQKSKLLNEKQKKTKQNTEKLSELNGWVQIKT